MHTIILHLALNKVQGLRLCAMLLYYAMLQILPRGIFNKTLYVSGLKHIFLFLAFNQLAKGFSYLS